MSIIPKYKLEILEEVKIIHSMALSSFECCFYIFLKK
jgi:hypothetical protein